jgi:hypothetical protein
MIYPGELRCTYKQLAGLAASLVIERKERLATIRHRRCSHAKIVPRLPDRDSIGRLPPITLVRVS